MPLGRRWNPGVWAIALVAAPVALGSAYSLAASVGLAGAGAGEFAPGRLLGVLSAAETWRSVGWTVWTAAVATVLASAGAMLIAILLRGVKGARALAVIPLAVPHVAGALAVLLLLGQSGLLSRVAFALGWTSQPADFPPLIYDRPGIGLILAFAWKELPFLALTALAVRDTRSSLLEEVARTLGANRRATWRRVTLPLLWRGMAPSIIAVFAFLLGQYEMAVLLGPSDPLPLPVLTYERSMDSVLPRRGEAHALALIALGLTLLLVIMHEMVRQPEDDA
ncbi:MAG: ABC transporter permease subunit [Gemmatimonadaceae bacterium]